MRIPSVFSSWAPGFPRSGKIALLTTMLAIGATFAPPAAAQEPPMSFPDLAKSIQAKVAALKTSPDGLGQPFLFGHFLKPPPPPKTEEEAQEAPIALPPEIKCQGVMQMGGALAVIINSGTFKKGEKVLGATITNITSTEVTFMFRNRPFKLPAR